MLVNKAVGSRETGDNLTREEAQRNHRGEYHLTEPEAEALPISGLSLGRFEVIRTFQGFYGSYSEN